MSPSTADGVACEPCTASENAVTSVASRSTVTSPPPVHGVAPPAPEVGVGGAVASLLHPTRKHHQVGCRRRSTPLSRPKRGQCVSGRPRRGRVPDGQGRDVFSLPTVSAAP